MHENDNKFDTMMENTQATAQWVLICTENGAMQTEGGIHLPKPIKQPFARVVSVGAMCKSGIEKGDRIIYKEGVNINELKGLTSKTYLFVWEPNVCGKAPPVTTV